MTGIGREGEIGYVGPEEPEEELELEEELEPDPEPEDETDPEPEPEDDPDPEPEKDSVVEIPADGEAGPNAGAAASADLDLEETAEQSREPASGGAGDVKDVDSGGAKQSRHGKPEPVDHRGAEITDLRWAELLEIRARQPNRIGKAGAKRKRRPLLRNDCKLLLVAADHTGFPTIADGSNPTAAVERRDVLTRLLTGLSEPGIDGVLATPDITEDLLLLDALNDRVAIGCMNHGSPAGSAWEPDYRVTAYGADDIHAASLDGAMMRVRMDFNDPAAGDSLEACASAVTALAGHDLPIFLEPRPVSRDPDGSPQILTNADALMRAAEVAAALGGTSAYTWLTLPVMEGLQRVVAATTLPVLLVIGDPGAEDSELAAGWKRALAIPQVRGLIGGRDLLYPSDGDVVRAVRAAARIVHG